MERREEKEKEIRTEEKRERRGENRRKEREGEKKKRNKEEEKKEKQIYHILCFILAFRYFAFFVCYYPRRRTYDYPSNTYIPEGRDTLVRYPYRALSISLSMPCMTYECN